MYFNDKVKLVSLFIVVFFIFFYCFEINITESLMQNFITFLSITFGFYMTSLSVLYSSKYIKRLYDEVDELKKTQTKIHTLKAYFKNSAYWSILSIIVLFIYSLFSKVNGNILETNSFFESLIISILSINFLFLILLLKVFLNGLLEEAGSCELNK